MMVDSVRGRRHTYTRAICLAMLPWMIGGGVPLPLLGAQQAQTPPSSPPPQGPPPSAASPAESNTAPPAPPVIQLVTPAPSTPPAKPTAPAGAPGAAAGPPEAAPAPAAAATPAVAGKKIAGLEFKGLKTLSEETLLYYLGLEIGQTLDEERLNQAIKSLWDRGLVDDLKVDYTLVPAGVKLTIIVQERPILRSIDYEGLKRLSK
jgi:outer membrane protein insertion porin family